MTSKWLRDRRFLSYKRRQFPVSGVRGASASCIALAMLPNTEPNRPEAPAASRSRWRRLAPVVVLALAMAAVFATGLHRELSLEALVRHRAIVDGFVAGNGPGAVAVFIAIYIAAAALSIPGAVILSVTGGLLFGTIVGGAAAVAGATIGGTIIFLVARGAIGEWLTRSAGPHMTSMLAGFRADGFNYLLFLRLVPLFPFWLVNLVAALGGMDVRTFVTATVVGIIPATFAFAYFGAGLDSVLIAQEAAFRACLSDGRLDCRLDFDPSAAATPQLIGAFVVLGLVALLPVVVNRMREKRQRLVE